MLFRSPLPEFSLDGDFIMRNMVLKNQVLVGTVNAGRGDFNDRAEPFANHHGASLRMLSDLGEAGESLFIHSGGQSGNPLSAQYRAFSAAWARGEYVPMITERKRLEAAGAQRLLLTPRK